MRASSEVNDDAPVQFTEPFRPTLSDQALALQKDFDRQHDLGGLSFAKTWGLASWGTYVSSCVSYHPGDMVEYNLTSGERCHVFFTLADTTPIPPDSADFPWQEISSSKTVKDSDSIVITILTAVNQQPLQEAHDRKILYTLCCAGLLSSDSQTLRPAEEAFRRLAVSTNANMEHELSLLEDARALNLPASQRLERLNHIIVSRSGREDNPPTHELCDLCSICEQAVEWVNLTEAACVAGHQFGMVTARPQLTSGEMT